MPQALEGVRVLDFSRIWAGPHATKLLADMGAEIIKVESTSAWDPHRMIVGSGNLPDGELGPDPWNRSGWFNTLHMSKYGITADIRHARGKAVIEELVSISDVVVENFRAGLMERRGLGYETMRALRPDIIVVSMPALGNTGPWKDFIQYGIGQEQLGGISSMNGYRDDKSPIKSGVNFGDPISGAHAASAVLSALYYRRRTGKGVFIDLSQLESSICLIGEHIIGQQMNGRSPENIGNRHPAHAPHGAYPCEGEDAWVTIAVTSDEQWRNLAEEMGDSDLANDARFADLISRYRHQDELDEIISSWTRDKSGQEIMRALQSRGISCAPVYKVEDIFNDPQFQDRELLELVDHPATGPYFLPGAPWKMSGTPGKVRWPAPTLGQHNQVVFGEILGMSDGQIQGLDDAGVTGTVPDPMKNTTG